MKFLVILLLPLFSIPAIAQEKNSIIGRILNGETNAPVPNASVFITNTSRGTITNSSGDFELRGIPNGNYDLVISSVGYSTHVYSFSSDKLPLKLRVLLQPKAVELDAVTVEPFEQDGWEKWGKLFTENFIGTSGEARQCRIRNYKTIHFRYSKKNKILEAVADEPLIIQNNALGYRIQYQLEEFRYSFNERTLFYLGYTLFEDMGKNRKTIPRRYVAARKKAYLGSMMHFVRSLYFNKLEPEGFEVRRLVKTPNLEKQRVKKLKSEQSLSVNSNQKKQTITISGGNIIRNGDQGDQLTTDSSDYYSRVLRQPDEIEIIGRSKLPADSLVSVVSDGTKLLFFPDYLHIKYKALEEKEYLLQSFMQYRKPNYQMSTVFLLQGSPLEIAKNGSYAPPQEFFSSGYWAWSEKISHLLPVDYEP